MRITQLEATNVKRLRAVSIKPDDEDRFLARVDRSGGPAACWEWLGYRMRSGLWHGQVRIGGVCYLAHRVSWVIANGAIPGRLCVCHHCDNPGCVNPAHLFLGTPADNHADCVAKGRASGNTSSCGERNARSKLTAPQVREIRLLHSTGRVTLRELARQFGVTRPAIGYVVNGHTWKHLLEAS